MNTPQDQHDSSITDPEDRRIPFWFWALMGLGISSLIIVPIISLIRLD